MTVDGFIWITLFLFSIFAAGFWIYKQANVDTIIEDDDDEYDDGYGDGPSGGIGTRPRGPMVPY